MRPVNGSLNSRIRKIEADAESAKMLRATMVVVLLSAKRVKLANMMASQETKYYEEGIGIAATSANRSKRVLPISRAVSSALAFRERSVSSCADSFRISS